MARPRELDKTSLFADLGYEPHGGQRAVHASRASRRILACGVRWGKSTCAAMECVAALLQPREESLGWVVAPTYDLTGRVFSIVVDLFERKLPHRVKEHLQRERMLVVRNLGGGVSRLQAKSADYPTSLLGEGLDFLVVDEAASMGREIWQRFLSQRLVDRRGWALLVSTPKKRDWFFKLVRRGQRGEAGFASWISPSWENPRLDRAAIEAEREHLPAEAFAQEFGAEFLGRDEESCDRCGGPSERVGGLVVVKKGRELPLCRECGLETDLQGDTIVGTTKEGLPRLKLIVFPDDGEPDPFVCFPPLSVLDPWKEKLEAEVKARDAERKGAVPLIVRVSAATQG